MLVLLEKLPDVSEFKRWADRAGEYSRADLIAAKTHNVLGKLTSAYLSAHGVEGEEALYYPFESYLEHAERLEAAKAEEQEDAEFNLYSSFGWS